MVQDAVGIDHHAVLVCKHGKGHLCLEVKGPQVFRLAREYRYDFPAIFTDLDVAPSHPPEVLVTDAAPRSAVKQEHNNHSAPC
jgi:hypothetical protein